MTVVDARSGKIVKVGDTVDYGHGEKWTLLGVKKSWSIADALILTPAGKQIVKMPVRFTHPSFFGRWIAFFPS